MTVCGCGWCDGSAGARVVSRVQGVSVAELRGIVDAARSGKGVAGAKPFIKEGSLLYDEIYE